MLATIFFLAQIQLGQINIFRMFVFSFCFKSKISLATVEKFIISLLTQQFETYLVRFVAGHLHGGWADGAARAPHEGHQRGLP